MQTSKKYIGIIIALLIVVVLTSGCTYISNVINPIINPFINSSNNYSVDDTSFNDAANISTKSFSAYGVNFKYPSSWNVNYDNETGPTMIFVNKDYPLFNGAQFQVQVAPNNGMSEQGVVDDFHGSVTPGWTNIGSYKLTVDNKTAYEDVYTVNDTHYSKLMKMVSIILVKNDKTYLMLLQAPDKEFDSEKPNFSVILKSFMVQ